MRNAETAHLNRFREYGAGGKGRLEKQRKENRL